LAPAGTAFPGGLRHPGFGPRPAIRAADRDAVRETMADLRRVGIAMMEWLRAEVLFAPRVAPGGTDASDAAPRAIPPGSSRPTIAATRSRRCAELISGRQLVACERPSLDGRRASGSVRPEGASGSYAARTARTHRSTSSTRTTTRIARLTWATLLREGQRENEAFRDTGAGNLSGSDPAHDLPFMTVMRVR
jgi:hypothetical protein